MVYAYLRVSTQEQILENQLSEIDAFASSKGIKVDHYVQEHVSGTKKSADRKLGYLIKRLKEGDILIISEISRLSRKMTEIMTIMQKILDKKVILYSIKERFSFEDTINSKVLCFAFGLVAEIERNLISMRTKEALDYRRKSGVTLGRPSGSGKISRLSDESIKDIVESDVEERGAICRKYGFSESTYYRIRRDYHNSRKMDYNQKE